MDSSFVVVLFSFTNGSFGNAAVPTFLSLASVCVVGFFFGLL